jgi:hypothetical protein
MTLPGMRLFPIFKFIWGSCSAGLRYLPDFSYFLFLVYTYFAFILLLFTYYKFIYDLTIDRFVNCIISNLFFTTFISHAHHPRTPNSQNPKGLNTKTQNQPYCHHQKSTPPAHFQKPSQITNLK